MAKAGPGDPVVSRIFWIHRWSLSLTESGTGMTEKGLIQRSYKMMSIVKTRLLRRGPSLVTQDILE